MYDSNYESLYSAINRSMQECCCNINPMLNPSWQFSNPFTLPSKWCSMDNDIFNLEKSVNACKPTKGKTYSKSKIESLDDIADIAMTLIKDKSLSEKELKEKLKTLFACHTAYFVLSAYDKKGETDGIH